MSDLENKMGTSKLSQIYDQYKQWRNDREHFDNYLFNCVRILNNKPPIDYRYINHGNLVVHSTLCSMDYNRERRQKLINDALATIDFEV